MTSPARPAAPIVALLRAGPPPDPAAYPLPPGEDPASWLRRAVAAAEQLARHPDAGPILEAARAILGEPIAPALARRPGRVRLAGDLLRNLADPGRITQGLKGTCAATCVETWLAERHPARLARIVAGLCSPDGRAPLPGVPGKATPAVLVRDENVLAWNEAEGRRSPVSRLFQAAAMQFAEPTLDYQNLVDGFVADDRVVEGPGLDLQEFEHLLEAVSGQEWALVSRTKDAALDLFGIDDPDTPRLDRDGLAILRRSTAAGDPCFVTLASPLMTVAHVPGAERLLARHPEARHTPLPHKVRVIAVHDAPAGGADAGGTGGEVVYDDPLDPAEPWIPGVRTRIEDRKGRCAMPVADFLRLATQLSYRPAPGGSGADG